MYEKQLMGRKVLYFQYAPPMTRLDDCSADVHANRPNPPFKDAPLWQRSVYYYWWAFLRENQAYMKTCQANGVGEKADLYADFGDIRDDDFMGWWRKGGRLLFCEPPQEAIEVYPSPPLSHDNERRVLLSLPLMGDLDRTLAELKQLLKPVYQDANRSQSTESQAKYQIQTLAVMSSLHQHWQAWQARKAHPDAPLADLADLAGIAAGGQGPADDRLVRNSKAVKIGRYLKGAKALIHNVGFGRFPDFSNSLAD
jgi:hypothetical protein